MVARTGNSTIGGGYDEDYDPATGTYYSSGTDTPTDYNVGTHAGRGYASGGVASDGQGGVGGTGGGAGYPPNERDTRAGTQSGSYNPWDVGMPPTSSGYSWNGSPTSGAQAGAADYEGVQDFSDAAYNNARRYLDPQQAFDNRRFDQEIINRGVDPNSPQGQMMYEQMMRAHGDQDQGAAFGAMEFGQGIQEQMFRQNFDNTQQAGDMQKASWTNDTNRQRTQLDRQRQDFDEYMGYNSIDFRDEAYDENNRRYDQQYQDDIVKYLMEYGNPAAGGGGGVGGGSEGGSSLTPWGDYWDDQRGTWKF